MATPTQDEYYSVTEYPIRESEADAIVEGLGYYCTDFYLSVIWFRPSVHVHLRRSITKPFKRHAYAGAGLFDYLPAEILQEILLGLDMVSLLNLQQTNIRARQLVNSMHQFRVVVLRGMNTLWALLRTGLATRVTLDSFYKLMCTKNCSICGRFGGFVSLIAWRRCCFVCVQKGPQVQVRSLASVKEYLRLCKSQASQLTSFKTLPGHYSTYQTEHARRVNVVSLHEAALVSGRPNLAAAEEMWTDGARKYNYMGACALPYYDKGTEGLEYGVSCAGCELAYEVGIIGPQGQRLALEAVNMVYGSDGFLKHFRRCAQAQRLWDSSEGGTKKPPELPELAETGGCFCDKSWRWVIDYFCKHV